jgi:hypothetical protein
VNLTAGVEFGRVLKRIVGRIDWPGAARTAQNPIDSLKGHKSEGRFPA